MLKFELFVGNVPRRVIPVVAGIFGLAFTSSVFAANGTDTWTGSAGDNNWATAGNWAGVNAPPIAGDTPAFGAQGAGSLTLNNNITAATSFLGLTFNAGAPSFTLTGNSITTTGGIVDNSTNAENVSFPIILNGTHSVNAMAGGMMTLSGVISGSAAGITKTGGGTVDLNGSAVNTYTGTTTANAGTLLVDFSNLGTTANLISSSSALAFGGGTLQINSSPAANDSQKFASTTLNAGGSVLSGNVNPTITLGAFTTAAGGTIVINGPAYSSAPSTSSGQTGAAGNGDTTGLQPATATLTTTTAAGGSQTINTAFWSPGSGNTAYYCFGTVGLYDFAAISGSSSPYNVVAYSQLATSTSGFGSGDDGSYYVAVTAFDNNNGVFDQHFDDIVGNFTAPSSTTSFGGLRYNFNGALTTTLSSVVSLGGILVTPNVGANNDTIATTSGEYLCPGFRSSGNSGSLVIWQNNTNGFLIISGVLNDGKTSGGSWVQTGAGTVVYNGINTFTGPLYLNGGISEISADSGLGAPGSGTTVNMNGGTILGAANFTLDNSGSNKRGIALGNNGGSLAAVGGTTMKVDGVISGSTPLTIGIPAANVNGNVAGQVPGTGAGTANASVMATGTVALSGANTYTGGTILDTGILNIGSTGLGTGGVTFNGGTLQWATGTSNDISSQTVTMNFTGGTLDANGNPVTLASAIGNNGGGALTVQSSVAGGVLILKGSSTYTGGTTVSSGTLNANNTSGSATGTNTVTVQSGAALGGTGTITGNVNWQSGALGSFATGSQLTVGEVTLNNNSVIVNVPGATPLQPGTYTLLNYNVTGSTGSFNTGAPTYTGAGVTPGTISAVSTSGGTVTLTVTAVAGIVRTWVGDSVANNWDFTTTNWLNEGVLDTYSDGNLVIFDDTGSDSPAINLTTTVQPGSLLVNAAQNYTFIGSGQISGATTLVKTNTGTLIIRTLNSYSGVTTIGQGTLQVGSGTIAGALGTNLVQDNASLVLDLPGSRTFANVVSGTGSLTQASAGTLTLTASNTYTGGTTISAGTLQLNSGAWLGSGGITDNGTLVFNQSGNVTVSAIIGGTGGLTLSGSGIVTLTGHNTYGGSTTINNGTLLANNSSGSVGAGPVTVNNGGQLGGGGAINGAVIINSGGTLSPGNSVGTLTINNNLTANSGANVNFTLGTTSDKVVVGGNLNLSGTLNITAGSGLNTTTYTLFTYSGTLTLGTVTLNLPANTMAAINTNTPGQVNLVVQTLSTSIPAFPGALGFGQFVFGARIGGSIYHVTNTNDSGAGSFRDAVSQANRFVVFDIGGTIILQSAVTCQSSLTIAGQTAPGGIAIIGHEVSFSVRTNDIVRFLRIRPGSIASSTEDGINMGDATNMIFDHLSLEFAPYNTIDATGNDTGGNQITMENCILADPIGQQFNAHTEALGNTFSWFYNIFSSGHDRNPLAKINTVFINNIVNNFQAGYTCADTSGHFSHDIVNNYFITGPATSSASDDFFQFDGNQSVYAAGNLLDSDNNGTLDGSSTAPGGGSLVLNSPWSSVTTNTPTYSTTTAYRYVVSTAGAYPQDQVDQLVMNDVTSLGTVGMGGGLWTSQTQTGLTNNGYGGLVTGTLPTDTDGDGIPDYYEEATGSNPNVADSLTPGIGGYTKLENYLNWLAAPHAITTTNTPVNVDLWQYTAGFTNAAPVYSVGNPTNGTVTLISGHIVDFTPKMGFLGLGSFQFAVTANDGSAITNTVTVCVTPLGAVANYAAPIFSLIMKAGNGLAMTGTGGITNANFVLLNSTNLAVPVSQWTSLTTNRFDGNGNFNFTNPANASLPQSFYLLELP